MVITQKCHIDVTVSTVFAWIYWKEGVEKNGSLTDVSYLTGDTTQPIDVRSFIVLSLVSDYRFFSTSPVVYRL